MKIDNAKDMMGSTRAALQSAEARERKTCHALVRGTTYYYLKRKVVNRIRVLLLVVLRLAGSGRLPYSLHHVRDIHW